jgi:hypothetical protein
MLPQSPMPKVSLVSVNVEETGQRLKSFVALVEFGPREARIELNIGCNVSFDYGLENCVRVELHQLIGSLDEWVKAKSPIEGTKTARAG